MDKLKSANNFFESQLQEKDSRINFLTQFISNINNYNKKGANSEQQIDLHSNTFDVVHHKNHEQSETNCDNHWNVTNKKGSFNHNTFQLKNRFASLESDDYDFNTVNEIHYNDDTNVAAGSQVETTGILADVNNSKFRMGVNFKRPVCVINEHPENDIIQVKSRKTIPGNTSYANLAERGKKVCILGDSISKMIDIVEFSELVNNGYAIKRSFPGAAASQLKYNFLDEINAPFLIRFTDIPLVCVFLLIHVTSIFICSYFVMVWHYVYF